MKEDNTDKEHDDLTVIMTSWLGYDDINERLSDAVTGDHYS